MEMAKPGSFVHFLLRSATGQPSRLTGRVVEEGEGKIVVAVLSSKAPEGVGNTVAAPGSSDQPGLTFFRLALSSVSSVLPVGWSKETALPKLSICTAAWSSVGKKVDSSDAEKPADKKEKVVSGMLSQDLERLAQVLEHGGDESEDSSEESDEAEPRGRSFLAPGKTGAASGPGRHGTPPKEKKKSRESEVEPTDKMMQLVEDGLARGQNPSELMPYMMFSMMMKQQQDGKTRRGKKGRRSSDRGHGGSSSESSSDGDNGQEKGMRAVASLHRLHKKIQKHPRQVYRSFEKEIVEELGVVEGQAWTMRQWIQRQSWGKFRGIQRCCIQDGVVYELLRNHRYEEATAQLAQNMKSKVQSAIQLGDWSSAWLLTGIPDPMGKKEWGGTKEEMAVVSEYINSLAKLRKRVKEAKETGNHGAEEADEEHSKK